MQKFLDVVSETVNPATQPVGVNLLTSLDSLVDKKIKVRNKKLAVCQQIAYSRMYGWSTLVDIHSAHCVLGAACVGLIEPPSRVLNGEVNVGIYQEDLVAAQAMQQQMPRVVANKLATLTYPCKRPVEGFSPEVIIVYVNSAQAMRFIQSFLYCDGGEFVMKSSGDAGVCSRGIAQVVNDDKPTIEFPCLGDRRFAMTQDHEVIVAIPYSWQERVADGLKATHKAGIRYPIPFQIPGSCDLPPDYTVSQGDY